MISLTTLIDYWFCPAYVSQRRENYVRNIAIGELQDRFEHRKQRFETYLKLKKELEPQKRKKKKKKEQQSISKWFKQLRYTWLEKRIHPRYLLQEERKVNPQLTLIDFEQKISRIYTDIKRKVIWKNGFVVTIDHSDRPLPSYAPYIPYPDMMKLALHMHLLHLHFFTDKITGVIQYKNKTCTIKWTDSRVEKMIKKAREYAKKIPVEKNNFTPLFPFRCAKCELKEVGCEKSSTFPSLATNKKKNENVEKTYKAFGQAADAVFQTYWEHWKYHIKELSKVIHSSPLIKQYIQRNVTDAVFDMEEWFLTSALNKKGMYNSYVKSGSKEEFTFCYQLILYLERSGQQGKMKNLIGSYGMKQGFDNQTHLDILIKQFFQKMLRHFVTRIDAELYKHKPNKSDKNEYNLNHSQLVISYDQSNVSATMIINKNEDEQKE